MNKAEEKVVRDILSISDEYEQALFNYQFYCTYAERGGDRPKGIEYFKREVEVVKQYAAEVRREVAEDAFKAGMVFQQFDTAKDFNEWYDWFKQQEE